MACKYVINIFFCSGSTIQGHRTKVLANRREGADQDFIICFMLLMLSVFHWSTFGIFLHETLAFLSLSFQFVFSHVGSVSGNNSLEETHIPPHSHTSLAWHFFITDGM